MLTGKRAAEQLPLQLKTIQRVRHREAQLPGEHLDLSGRVYSAGEAGRTALQAQAVSAGMDLSGAGRKLTLMSACGESSIR